VLAGSTKRIGCREAGLLPSLMREPWSPRQRAAGVVLSGVPEWAMIQSMIAGESAPAARIAARSRQASSCLA
jgi:hypothetical protein